MSWRMKCELCLVGELGGFVSGFKGQPLLKALLIM